MPRRRAPSRRGFRPVGPRGRWRTRGWLRRWGARRPPGARRRRPSHDERRRAVAAAKSHYEGVALPKLLAELRGLELSPIDGRTLTEFLHARGIGMRSLGRIVEATDGLRHMQEVSLAEVIARSAKVLLRAAMATHEKAGVGAAARAAAVLNGVLCEADTPLARAVWGWLVRHARVRFGRSVRVRGPPGAEGPQPCHGAEAAAASRCSPASVARGARGRGSRGAAAATRARAATAPTAAAGNACQRAAGRGRRACTTSVVRTASCGARCASAVPRQAGAYVHGRALPRRWRRSTGPSEHAGAGRARQCAAAYAARAARPPPRSLLAVALYHTGDFRRLPPINDGADTCERAGLDHLTHRAYGDPPFLHRLQRTELALVYVRRSLQLLGMACGAEHPNTAATFINIAMMEEGCGQTQLALRYLHEALACNRRLLGRLHVQTAAAYHALAIALSLSEAYGLSVSHEQQP